MFSTALHLYDVELKLRGLDAHRRLEGLRVRSLTVDAGRLPGHAVIAALPVLDAAVALAGEAPRTIRAPAGLRAIIEQHITHGVRPHATGDGADLEVLLHPEPEQSAVRLDGDRVLLTVSPLRPASASLQDCFVSWLRGGMAAGLWPLAGPPRLRLSPAARRGARRWLRRCAGARRGRLVAVCPRDPRLSPLYCGLLERLEARLGGEALQMSTGSPVPVARPAVELSGAERAAALLGCAVCIGDDASWCALAAALGVPALHLCPSPDSSPPRARRGLEPLLWGTEGRAFASLLAASPYGHDLTEVNAAGWAERLAALRWPADRLFRFWP